MASSRKALSIPLIMLKESKGHVVKIELQNGETYEGRVVRAESNMSVFLQDVLKRAHDGKRSRLQHVYIRGGTIVLVTLPNVLSKNPIFENQ